MGPGAELPALLAHLRLLEPMYSQSRELWDTVAPIWGRSMFQWMQKLINSRVVIQHLHPQRQELCWTWCSNFAMGWRADPRSMLAWVDSHMYSTVNTDPEVLTRKYIVSSALDLSKRSHIHTHTHSLSRLPSPFFPFGSYHGMFYLLNLTPFSPGG